MDRKARENLEAARLLLAGEDASSNAAANRGEQIRKQASELAGGRIVRWTDGRTCPMHYEGWEWTLELFDVPKSEQRELHRLLWHHLYERVWERFGRGLVFVFHTKEDTDRLYPWVRHEEAGASPLPQPVR